MIDPDSVGPEEPDPLEIDPLDTRLCRRAMPDSEFVDRDPIVVVLRLEAPDCAERFHVTIRADTLESIRVFDFVVKDESYETLHAEHSAQQSLTVESRRPWLNLTAYVHGDENALVRVEGQGAATVTARAPESRTETLEFGLLGENTSAIALERRDAAFSMAASPDGTFTVYDPAGERVGQYPVDRFFLVADAGNWTVEAPAGYVGTLKLDIDSA